MRFRLYRLLRWAEIDLPLYSLVHILRSHEDRDPRLHHAAGLCDYGGGSHVHIARQIENNNEVIAAKGVIERFEFAAHILGELFDHRSPFRAALLQQALQTLISVRTLHKIFRHSVSSFKACGDRRIGGADISCQQWTSCQPWTAEGRLQVKR